MSLYKPSELRHFLTKIGIQPKKGLSQNFLIDGNVLRKMVQAADLKKEDTALEIGPGPGVLTEALLKTGAKVITIEKDETLATHLNRLQNKNLSIIVDDFRNVALEALATKDQKVKVVANIPYSLTGVILQKLLPRHDLIASLHLMVQKEVAERCTAPIKTKDYSSFTVFTNYHADAKMLFTVSKRCFYPEPKVDSAVIAFKLKKPPVDAPYKELFEMIRLAFQMRRKMLRSSLKTIAPPTVIENSLERLGLPKFSRPQELTLAHLSSLFHLLQAEEK